MNMLGVSCPVCGRSKLFFAFWFASDIQPSPWRTLLSPFWSWSAYHLKTIPCLARTRAIPYKDAIILLYRMQICSAQDTRYDCSTRSVLIVRTGGCLCGDSPWASPTAGIDTGPSHQFFRRSSDGICTIVDTTQGMVRWWLALSHRMFSRRLYC